ncbi:MAG: hypothetical protein IH889_01260 [Planctomycetes bacterium]|nr:hypothetical protein [Planctomycetota bacterium]
MVPTGLWLAATVALLAGCASPAKKQYERHLSITLAPVAPGSAALAAFDVDRNVERRAVLAAADVVASAAAGPQ